MTIVNKLNEKLRHAFEDSAIKTVGDLAENIGFPGRENLPQTVVKYALSPFNHSATPGGYPFLMRAAKFSDEAAKQLSDAAERFKDNIRVQAADAVIPRP